MVDENFIWLDLNRLIWEFLHPALESYKFKQYQTSADMVYWCNMLLNGLSEGLELKPPKAVVTSIQDRQNPLIDYRTYVTKNMPGIAKSLGMVIAASYNKVRSKDQGYSTEVLDNTKIPVLPVPAKEELEIPPGV